MTKTLHVAELWLAVVCILLPVTAAAQPNLPCMSIGIANGNERAYALVQGLQENHDYVLAGYTDAVNSGIHDVMIVQADTFGVPGWVRVTPVATPVDYDDEATSMVASASDGIPGYVVTGWTRSQGVHQTLYPGNADIFVTKLDTAGNQIWGWTYGLPGDQQAYSIAEVFAPMDPGFIVTGWADHIGHRHVIVMKLTPAGVFQWAQFYDFVIGQPWVDEGYAIVEATPVGSQYPEYAVVGRAQTVSPNDYNAFVAKLNWQGLVMWTMVMPGVNDDEAYAVEYEHNTGRIIVSGWTNSYFLPYAPARDTNLFIWELDGYGWTTWMNIYGWYPQEERVMDDRSLVVDYSDGRYVVSGWTRSWGPGVPSGSNFLTLKVDPLAWGAPVWAREHPSFYDPDVQDDKAYPMIQTPGGFAIAGYNTGFAPGLEDMHLVTLDTAGWREICVMDTTIEYHDISYMEDTIFPYLEYLDVGPFSLVAHFVEYEEVCFEAPPPVRDVGALRITVPPDTVDTLTSYAPVCSLYNYGDSTETYPVTMRIGSFYVDTDTVYGHASKTAVVHTFSSYSDWPRGMHAMSCSTELSIDTDNSNDKVDDSVFGRVRDVGCIQIVQPAGTIDSGTTVTPACSLDNYGNVAAGYNVRMKVGTFYDTIVNVAGHAAGNRIGVSFPQWVATQVGTHTVTCSTELATDVVPANDKCTGAVTVRVPGGHDVACVEIFAPVGQTDSGTVITPSCSLYNFGGSAETFDVRMKVGSLYDTIATVTSLAAGAGVRVNFPVNWTADPVGFHAVRCSTELGIDDTPGNDRHADQVLVRRLGADVGCTAVIAPSGNYPNGTLVTPRCTVFNHGNTTPTYTVRMWIGSVYDTTATVTAHPTGTYRVVNFPTWTAGPNGSYAVTAFTELGGDVCASNDTATGSCTVGPVWPYGWVEVASMPTLPSLKPVKRGGWLAYNDDNGIIYAAKGYKTNDFYSYNPSANTWTQIVGMPYTTHPLWYKKAPRKGAKGAYDGINYIYATQGNNSLGFWRYSVADDSWEILDDVPLGPSRKKVKGGTDLAYVVHNDTGYVYCLKGYKTEFYRYNTVSNDWEGRADAPTGRRAKWDKGSWLCVEDAGASIIYAHKAKYHELYAYYVDVDTWSTDTTLTGMPFIGASGRRKKSKDGGCGAWYSGGIYALKGGNTGEFWVYDVGTDAWNELDTMPSYGTTGKKKRVKYGADIVSIGGGAFFALKGNKTVEMWRYVLAAPMASSPLPRAGIMARPMSIDECRLTVAPNPLAGGFATLRYSLPVAGPATVSVFDVAGRVALRRTLAATRDGCIGLDLRTLSAGAYIVRLDVGDYSTARKLVVQR